MSQSMRRFSRSALNAILDFAFPRSCPICGKASNRPGRTICWDCTVGLKRLVPSSPVCRICGESIDARLLDGLCTNCRRRKPHFDIARSVFVHEDDARSLVHGLKYRRQTWLAEDIADYLEALVRASFDIHEIDGIIPVPLHPMKFVFRTYNQTTIIASALSRRLAVPMRSSLLSRTKDTATQTHLGAKSRHVNIYGAFQAPLPEMVKARTFLVVDDVMTTGATLDEIAKVLKNAGAWRIWGATLCRAKNPHTAT